MLEISGGAYDNNTSNDSYTNKGKTNKRGTGKGKQVDVVETVESSKKATTVSYLSQTPTTFGALSCNSEIEQKGWIMEVTINSLSSTRRQAGAECLLLDSGAQLRACLIKYRGQKVPLLDPGIHTANGARFQHDGGRLVTLKLPEGLTIRVLFHTCEVQKPIFSLLVVSLSRCTGVIFAQTHVHCSFLTRSRHTTQPNTVAQGREFVLCQRDADGTLGDSWCESRCRSKVTDADWPQTLDDVEEPMPARLATLKDPGTSDQIVLDQHSLTHFLSQPWCKMCVASPGRKSHIENSRKSMQRCLNLSLTTATWEMEALCRLRVSSLEQRLFLKPYTRRWWQKPRKWTCPTWLPKQRSACVTWCIDSTQKIDGMSSNQWISDPSTYAKKRTQRSDYSNLLRHMDDVVGTGPEEHLMSDFEHMETSLYFVFDGCGGVAQ